MKKYSLLIFSCILASIAAGCDDDDTTSFTSEDEGLAGETVTAGDENAQYAKLFVLNEGSYGQNNASLDFFRYSDGKYVRNSFSQMNPSLSSGLGDVGNDIQIHGSEAWIVVNNSGLVEVISAIDEKHIAIISVPTPRNIAFDDEYAYVSSWAGAYYGGDARKGAVYRIDLSTKTVKDTVNVGYQPEGLVAVDGNLYVANSGGVNPNGYENSVSIISTANFKVTGDITLPTHKNLQSIVADDDGNIWVSSFGDYYSVHSGFAKIDLATNEVTEINTTVSTDLWFDQYSKRILFIGSDKEWDWTATDKQYTLYFYNKELDGATGIVLGSGSLKDIKHPYAVASDPQTGDLFIGDSSDGKSPGTLFYLSERNTAMYAIRWSATAGLFPGHFAFYSR